MEPGKQDGQPVEWRQADRRGVESEGRAGGHRRELDRREELNGADQESQPQHQRVWRERFGDRTKPTRAGISRAWSRSPRPMIIHSRDRGRRVDAVQQDLRMAPKRHQP